MKLLLNTTFRFSVGERTALVAACPGLTIAETTVADPDTLDGAGVEVLVTELVPRDLARWPDLRWVQLLSAGTNQLRGHPIWDHPVKITNASGTHGVSIAQYITCMWLMMVHRMPEQLEFKATRIWPNRTALACHTVRALTVGIVGYGAVGRESARQLHALGMNVLCLKRDPSQRRHAGFNGWPGTGDPAGTIPSAWFAPDELDAMLPACDLLVVTVPGTGETQGMIGAPQFALMKKTARLISITRSGIVRDEDLAAALRAGQIAGAAVDCFVKEPVPPDHDFFDVPGLIMTPHMSGVHTGFWPITVDLIAANLRLHHAAQPLLNEVGRQAAS